MRKLRVFLAWPFSLVWFCAAKIRNFFYDTGILASTAFPLPVVCVGNLAAGGTGKTPVINYLVAFLLASGKKVAILSRGYGRKTSGFRIADDQENAATIGDEPYLFYKRWRDNAVVAVGERRVPAIKALLQHFPALDIVLMDDGFQHRAVRPSGSILLTTFSNPFYSDFVLPAGNLRESRRGAERAAMVVVTKCPNDMPDEKKGEMLARINAYTKYGTKAFFSSVSYGKPVSFGAKNVGWTSSVILVTGIANATPLVEYLKATGVKIEEHIEKSDHYAYGLRDLEQIKDASKRRPESVVVTTEKDFVKMDTRELSSIVKQLPIFYIPIEFSFSKEKENFEASLVKLVENTHEQRD